MDGSVRALAAEVGCSRGRAGELLHIYDAFATELILLGKGNPARAEEMLARLTFRQFREVLKIDFRLEPSRAHIC